MCVGNYALGQLKDVSAKGKRTISATYKNCVASRHDAQKKMKRKMLCFASVHRQCLQGANDEQEDGSIEAVLVVCADIGSLERDLKDIADCATG